MKTQPIVGIDFETYSSESLPDAGLKNYVSDPYFKPLIVALAWDDHTDVYDLLVEDEREQFMVDMSVNNDVELVAHNALFETMVLDSMGIQRQITDSAVIAAVCGANRHLRGAAQQLLGRDKLDEDGELIKTFCIPWALPGPFEENLPTRYAGSWAQFKEYCGRDAELSRQIRVEWGYVGGYVMPKEYEYADVTLRMNQAGWPVDLGLVRQFRARYQGNLDAIVGDFEAQFGTELNLNSTPQLQAWCEKRGIKAKSFDKDSVAKMLRRLLNKAHLTTGELEVVKLLQTKQAIGGSALKKLDVILNVAHNGRVYDQYVHAGAGQSLRTSGRNVQMQNLKRLPEPVRDIDTVGDLAVGWSNDDLGDNMRQLFRASNSFGLLFVADYAAIESRGLAWVAGEEWKLRAYGMGADLYRALAGKMYNIPTTEVGKEQRAIGKAGELSCGYGAGPVAVRDFAHKMGLELSERESKQLVYDWRDACPKTVELWDTLNNMLHAIVSGRSQTRFHAITPDRVITMAAWEAPESLIKESGQTLSVVMELRSTDTHRVYMRRVFHGCYMDGRNVAYYKPSQLKSGNLWKDTYVDPKTGVIRKYNLYGGKLAGIFVQSLCREIFMERMTRLDKELQRVKGATLIGQFHDEVVVEWEPVGAGITRNELATLIEETLSFSQIADFPIDVKVQSDWRYTK